MSNKLNVFKRATTQNQSRIRTAQTKWIKHGHMCLWISGVALHHDIEPNSGPTAKPKCSSCNKTVRKNQAAILCKGCKRNYHGMCVGLRRDDTKKLHNFQADWKCLTCSLPQFSDSFFDSFNSSELSDRGRLNDANSDFFDTLHRYANKNFIIGSFNINALAGKFCELQDWIETFDILCLQETKIDASFPDSQFAVKGYECYRKDRKKGGGGILLYVRKSIPSSQVRIRSKAVEAILVDIQLGQRLMS